MANRLDKVRDAMATILLDQRRQAMTAMRRGFSLGGLLKVTLRAPLLGLCWHDLSTFWSGRPHFSGKDIADRLSLQHPEQVTGDPACMQNLAWLKEVRGQRSRSVGAEALPSPRPTPSLPPPSPGASRSLNPPSSRAWRGSSCAS